MPILENSTSLLRRDCVFPSPILQNLPLPVSFRVQGPKTPNFRVLLSKKSNAFLLNALKLKKKGYLSPSESEVQGNIDDDFDDNFFDETDANEFEDTSNDDDDDEVFVPQENMKKWFENRPRGFGEGKVYDTSIEDKLMEEIEQSRKAQFENINKLKQNAMKSDSKKDSLNKEDEVLVSKPSGIRVRLVNLPKKKNIHKDLQVAFKEVPGILDIVPVVSGNKKTRDPICKGIAFIDFKHEVDAKRFMENFSGRSISFGKVDKKINCEMLISKSPIPAIDRSVDGARVTYEEDDLVEIGSNNNLDRDISHLDSWDETSQIKDHDLDENQVLARWDDVEETTEPVNSSDLNFSEEMEDVQKPAIAISSSKQGKKLKKKGETVASDTRKGNTAKITVSGSAKRLKVKEKAILTGVFSKYGAGSVSTSNDRSK